jgi:hypothetical protein
LEAGNHLEALGMQLVREVRRFAICIPLFAFCYLHFAICILQSAFLQFAFRYLQKATSSRTCCGPTTVHF